MLGAHCPLNGWYLLYDVDYFALYRISNGIGLDKWTKLKAIQKYVIFEEDTFSENIH